MRLSVERKLQDMRIESIRAENRLLDAQATNRLRQLQNKNAARANDLGNQLVREGTAPGVATDLQKLDAVASKIREQDLSAEEQKAKIKRDAALAVVQRELQLERFKIDTARQIAKINQTAAENIAKLQQRIIEENKKFTAAKYEAEREIAFLQLNVLIAQQKAQQQKLQDELDAEKNLEKRLQLIDRINALAPLISRAETVRDRDLSPNGTFGTPPPALTGAGFSVPTLGVDYAEADTLTEKILMTEEAITTEKLKQVDLANEGNRLAAAADVDSIINKPLENANALAEKLRTQNFNPIQSLQDQVNILETKYIPRIKEARDQAEIGTAEYKFWGDALERANALLPITKKRVEEVTNTFKASEQQKEVLELPNAVG